MKTFKNTAPHMLAILLLCSCTTRTRIDNTKRWREHEEFPAAVMAAPTLMRDILNTTTALELEIERQ